MSEIIGMKSERRLDCAGLSSIIKSASFSLRTFTPLPLSLFGGGLGAASAKELPIYLLNWANVYSNYLKDLSTRGAIR